MTSTEIKERHQLYLNEMMEARFPRSREEINKQWGSIAMDNTFFNMLDGMNIQQDSIYPLFTDEVIVRL